MADDIKKDEAVEPPKIEEEGEAAKDQNLSGATNGATGVDVDTTDKNAAESKPEQEEKKPEPAPTKPQYRHDWYQTERDVCINIMIKRLKKENVCVQFQEKSVEISIDLNDGSKYEVNFNLAHSVVVEKCTTKVLNTKVELRLRKYEGLHWKTLESPTKQDTNPAAEQTKSKKKEEPKSPTKTADTTHKYPSSSHYTRDWDKLVAEVKEEEKNEKPEGDAALNKLFQQIYRDGSDEVKKAMNKSFVESGGTVLSTNWGEVGKGTVERKPPDGMEWREYEN